MSSFSELVWCTPFWFKETCNFSSESCSFFISDGEDIRRENGKKRNQCLISGRYKWLSVNQRLNRLVNRATHTYLWQRSFSTDLHRHLEQRQRGQQKRKQKIGKQRKKKVYTTTENNRSKTRSTTEKRKQKKQVITAVGVLPSGHRVLGPWNVCVLRRMRSTSSGHS